VLKISSFGYLQVKTANNRYLLPFGDD